MKLSSLSPRNIYRYRNTCCLSLTVSQDHLWLGCFSYPLTKGPLWSQAAVASQPSGITPTTRKHLVWEEFQAAALRVFLPLLVSGLSCASHLCGSLLWLSSICISFCSFLRLFLKLKNKFLYHILKHVIHFTFVHG